jgi:ethanolamine utilization protein EutQ (cupin superfamily)
MATSSPAISSTSAMGPVTIGFGRYGPNQILEEISAVHDTMMILVEKVTVSDEWGSVTVGPGEIIVM